MSPDDAIADILDLVNAIQADPSPGPLPDTLIIPRGPLHDALAFALSAPDRLRRTRAGRWSIDGRIYRTKRLALDSVRERLMAPTLLARGRRFVLTGEIERMEIKGVIVG